MPINCTAHVSNERDFNLKTLLLFSSKKRSFQPKVAKATSLGKCVCMHSVKLTFKTGERQ